MEAFGIVQRYIESPSLIKLQIASSDGQDVSKQKHPSIDDSVVQRRGGFRPFGFQGLQTSLLDG